MGGWDIFCAICGSTVSWHQADDLDDLQDEENQSAIILQNEETEWVNRFRCIMRDPDSHSLDKISVSDPANYDDLGACHIKEENTGNVDIISVYQWGGKYNEPLAFPCHDVCMHIILPKVISSISGRESLDTDALFRALEDLGTSSEDNYASYLDLVDYGEHMEDLHDQYWYLHPGVEYYMTNPDFIPALEEYYSDLPLNTQRSDSPLKSLSWREKLQKDMPWLYDFPQQLRDGQDVDWEQVYKHLLEKGQNENDSKILGLANRRRIWKLCERIASSYVTIQKAKDEEGQPPDIIQEAIAGRTVRLGKVQKAKPQLSRLFLLEDLADIEKGNTVLSFHWSEEGYLLAFGVKSSTSAEFKYAGSRDRSARSDEVQIAEKDWLRGFVFTTRSGSENTLEGKKKQARMIFGVELLFNHGEPMKLGANNGDKRLVHTSLGEVIIGLRLEWTVSIGILEIALLKHQKNVPSSQEDTNSGLDEHLWKDELPPSYMKISSPSIGYWSQSFSTEFHPLEAVVFGRDDDELSTLTSVSIDVQFGAIELAYSGGSGKKLWGPKPWAMKTFQIDGQGGERIVGVYGNLNNIPDGLRLVTNRNRQLLIGKNLMVNRQRILHSSKSKSKEFCGLYCGWTGNATKGQQRLDLLGSLSFPKKKNIQPPPAEHESPKLSELQDQNEMWWEPTAPPSEWKESGPLYGQCERTIRRAYVSTKPSQFDIVNWLDMIRSVDEVNVTFTHGDWTYPLDMYLVGIRLLYSDGTQGTVGPDRFLDYSDTNGENGMPWCWCNLGHTDKKELARFSHYAHDKFEIKGGDFIQCIRIWTNPSLSGIQFVTSAGLEGPKWGKCEGDAEAVIEFARQEDEPGQRAVGLKVATTDNERPTTYSDRIVAGLQALVKC